MAVFQHGQLRLYLLALLEQGPKHGYELITDLSDRFGGAYRPSPGTIYPRLARLEEDGFVRREEAGRRSTYALTDAGRRELDERRGELAALEEDIAESVRTMAAELREEVRGAMSGLRAELAAAAQRARATAQPAPPAPGEADRAASRARRAEIDVLVQRFRDEVRAEVRRADAAGAVTPVAVATVRTVLDGALGAIRSSLR